MSVTFFWCHIYLNGLRNLLEHEKTYLRLSGYDYWTCIHKLVFRFFRTWCDLKILSFWRTFEMLKNWMNSETYVFFCRSPPSYWDWSVVWDAFFSPFPMRSRMKKVADLHQKYGDHRLKKNLWSPNFFVHIRQSEHLNVFDQRKWTWKSCKKADIWIRFFDA